MGKVGEVEFWFELELIPRPKGFDMELEIEFGDIKLEAVTPEFIEEERGFPRNDAEIGAFGRTGTAEECLELEEREPELWEALEVELD